MDYSKLYYMLFNAVTNAIECIDSGNYGKAKQLLISVQRQTEELYIEGPGKMREALRGLRDKD